MAVLNLQFCGGNKRYEKLVGLLLVEEVQSWPTTDSITSHPALLIYPQEIPCIFYAQHGNKRTNKKEESPQLNEERTDRWGQSRPMGGLVARMTSQPSSPLARYQAFLRRYTQRSSTRRFLSILSFGPPDEQQQQQHLKTEEAVHSSMQISLLGRWLVLIAVVSLTTAEDEGVLGDEVFTNAFLVELNEPHGNDVATEVAKRNGFNNMGPVSTRCLPWFCMCFAYLLGV
ncbi:uncharacterized protein CDAR_481651 [Caerostris darwini]|uniref:Peptidase S8 pro-domain domain-containing protein n=1 Tax=Caerostris darwini TaxID=1538125 RepID=A0AAV4UWW1_9ARAC|nr:uncharacterized protein CDAR_481651 [Caerostris darwini]